MARRLTKQSQTFISKALDDLFERLKARLIPENYQGKGLAVLATKDNTLRALFMGAGEAEGAKPSNELFHSLASIASNYLDAVKEKTKAQTISAVQSFLHEAEAKGVKTDVQTVLGGKLVDIYKEVGADVRRIVETETNNVKNFGTFDAITKIAAAAGKEPLIFFVVVRDGKRCEECTRLHLMPNKVTPRVWKPSEIGSGYHKRGDPNPKIGGLHPNCRCQMTSLFPGFGFDKSGMVTYIGPDHDEFKKQRS